MCTVSWLQRDSGYELFCNRDEKKTRAPARAPEVMDVDGVRFIAPTDSAAGGSWLAVNEHGLTVCLLNAPGMLGETDRTARTSRGRIVVHLATAEGLPEALDRVLLEPVVEYAPFRLILLEPRRAPMIVHWDGASRHVHTCSERLVSSSSLDDEGAQRARQSEFQRLIPDQGTAEDHLLFHRNHGRGASAYSPCMHRLDAETVSFTRVQVSHSQVVVHYSPVSPCRPCPIQVCRFFIRS